MKNKDYYYFLMHKLLNTLLILYILLVFMVKFYFIYNFYNLNENQYEYNSKSILCVNIIVQKDMIYSRTLKFRKFHMGQPNSNPGLELVKH